jgi:hypothetical protein
VFISEGADSSDTLKYILLFFQDSEWFLKSFQD